MEPKHYTPKELDDAVAQERERCLSMCRIVMDHHSEIAKIAAQEFDEENKHFIEGQISGAKDCIEAIEGKWDKNAAKQSPRAYPFTK